ncbi:hypothetical protein ACFQ6B_05280, partial [Streptomyces wedmorensis]|uniref:hypothetical protein n=1 Tax=Streptomyces wedmorensis TaxID=43759 RepID=UPI0036C8CD66
INTADRLSGGTGERSAAYRARPRPAARGALMGTGAGGAAPAPAPRWAVAAATSPERAAARISVPCAA